MGRHPVEECELEHAEPQGSEHRGLEVRKRPARQGDDQMVERGTALNGAVGQLSGQCQVAWVERQPLGLPAQRAIGPGALFEHPPQHGERAAPGWGDLDVLLRGARWHQAEARRSPTSVQKG
jgi:hypothetical protein